MILLDMKMPESCSECDLRLSGICEQGFDKEPCPIKAEIPDGATNGDVFKIMFPNNPMSKRTGYIRVENGKHYFAISESWWNAPYEGMKNER